ncbi:MAG: acetyl-CoA C-acetyltransferase, partial [Bdellovibrionota bacterium]
GHSKWAKIKHQKADTDVRKGKMFSKFAKVISVAAREGGSGDPATNAKLRIAIEKARELRLKPLAKIVSYAGNAQEPEWFTTAPTEAMRRAMKKAKWEVKDVDLFEVNEAFAVVAMSAQRDLGIPHEKLNIWGGAISLGHPIGVSGCRIVMTLVSQLKDLGKKRGVAGICIGGGEATAVCVELL